MLRGNDDYKRNGGGLQCCDCQACKCGRRCCTSCPPTPPPSHTPAAMQLQLQGAARVLAGNNQNILFDTDINRLNDSITYNEKTGEFRLPPNQHFFVSWWVAVDGTESATNVEFAVSVDHIPFAVGASPLATGQVSGSALVTTESDAKTIAVVNVSGNDIRYAANSVQANIVIVKLAF